MEWLFAGVLGTMALALLLVPAALIVTAYRRRPAHARGWILMMIGGLALCVVSLDILVTVVVARFGAEALASYALASAYVGDAINYVALVTLGVGMMRATAVADAT